MRLDSHMEFDKRRIVKCLGQRKQHQQLGVIYSDNADHMAWLTFRDNYKAGMRKG